MSNIASCGCVFDNEGALLTPCMVHAQWRNDQCERLTRPTIDKLTCERDAALQALSNANYKIHYLLTRGDTYGPENLYSFPDGDVFARAEFEGEQR